MEPYSYSHLIPAHLFFRYIMGTCAMNRFIDGAKSAVKALNAVKDHATVAATDPEDVI